MIWFIYIKSCDFKHYVLVQSTCKEQVKCCQNPWSLCCCKPGLRTEQGRKSNQEYQQCNGKLNGYNAGNGLGRKCCFQITAFRALRLLVLHVEHFSLLFRATRSLCSASEDVVVHHVNQSAAAFDLLRKRERESKTSKKQDKEKKKKTGYEINMW